MRKFALLFLVCILGITFEDGCASPQAREAGFLKRADSLAAKQEYPHATLDLLSAAKAMPNDPEPYYRLGLIKLAMGEPRDAVAAFQRALSLNPNYGPAKAKLAEMMTLSRNKADVEEAKTRLNEMVGAAPADTDAADALAFAEWKLGDSDDAARRLEATLNRFPDHLHASVTLARIKLSKHDANGAEEVLKAAAAAAPKSSPAALALCHFYLSVNRRAEAEPYAAHAVELDPQNGAAIATLAAFQASGGRVKDAEATYRRLSTLPDRSYRTVYGAFLFQSGEHERAISEFARLLQQDPNDRAARAALISAYFAVNRPRQAEDLVNSALKRNPEDVDALIERSRIYLKASKISEAESDLHHALHLRSDSLDAHYALAAVQRSLGRRDLERQELNAVLSLNPGEAKARLELGRSLTLSGSPGAAIAELDSATAAQKRMPGIIVERNWALLALGRVQEVSANIPDSTATMAAPELWLQSGLAKAEQRNFSGARQDAEQFLARRPDDIRGARLLAEAVSLQNGNLPALAMLKQMAAQHPHSGGWNHLYGEWLLRAGDAAGARRAFETAVTADPGFLGARLALANLDLADGRNESARNRLLEALKAEPHNVAALLMMAEAEQRLGDNASANARYVAILGVDSGNIVALNNLAYALARQDPDAALPYAQKALETQPGSAAVQDTLGWVYYRKSMYPTAVQYLKASTDAEPTAKHEFHLAMAYLKNGDRLQGQALLRAALGKDPNLPKTETGW